MLDATRAARLELKRTLLVRPVEQAAYEAYQASMRGGSGEGQDDWGETAPLATILPSPTSPCKCNV